MSIDEGFDLERFVEAQDAVFETALAEISRGRKRSHWMWYIFPQIAGLGASSTTKFYAVKDLAEAGDYLRHPVLGKRLIEISGVLLEIEDRTAHEIFGSPDDRKLKSSMTLFASLPDADPVFQKVLDKYYGGERDARTLEIIRR
jgi:uncharacterized protein (DUF1810 family)